VRVLPPPAPAALPLFFCSQPSYPSVVDVDVDVLVDVIGVVVVDVVGDGDVVKKS
jgi:hypothetical protein